ncbi:hypothetical protein N5D48_09805 [Pseudomonas sp. GD03858]|uniref:hypothetical protein n=1 Tax=unclassified Pseudomonas TaxID=196821 RepID=UPI0024488A71|nr:MULTISPECIES: hypothetical protein [unclassified Pseudomonas]MDH0646962.1 hypothetical protein [Pseudomonas sp. GD03867]MDH0662695.1 hypothetical protein [Pseudomonas sp. GD03858]
MASRPWHALTLVVLLAGTAWATEPRQFDYMLHCQGCHLPDGGGNPQRGVPAFPGQLGKFLWVPGGREYLVQVPGSALSGLSDDALAGVLNWMLARFDAEHLPTDSQPYTGAEVRRWRRSIPTDVAATRQQLLQRIATPEQRSGTHDR